jgi:hypothetical protein
MNKKQTEQLNDAIYLLNLHYDAFSAVAGQAAKTGHPVPCDTRGWSQILISLLTGIRGRSREKGADLIDGSDVKAANTWEAIDTPRFNGCVKAGTRSRTAGRIESLDAQPYLFFVLWDQAPKTQLRRCRVWCVRTQRDRVFRRMAQNWYEKVGAREIVSTNFQLHPPRGKDTDEIRNKCGNLLYPLLLCAERADAGYRVRHYAPAVLNSGECRPSSSADLIFSPTNAY